MSKIANNNLKSDDFEDKINTLLKKHINETLDSICEELGYNHVYSLKIDNGNFILTIYTEQPSDTLNDARYNNRERGFTSKYLNQLKKLWELVKFHGKKLDITYAITLESRGWYS